MGREYRAIRAVSIVRMDMTSDVCGHILRGGVLLVVTARLRFLSDRNQESFAHDLKSASRYFW